MRFNTIFTGLAYFLCQPVCWLVSVTACGDWADRNQPVCKRPHTLYDHWELASLQQWICCPASSGRG